MRADWSLHMGIEVEPLSALAAFPGQFQTSMDLQPLPVGGQTRLAERARKPPSVSKSALVRAVAVARAEKGEREHVSNSLVMQAQTSAHTTTTFPSDCLTDRSKSLCQ